MVHKRDLPALFVEVFSQYLAKKKFNAKEDENWGRWVELVVA
jgi:hypothetical protein